MRLTLFLCLSLALHGLLLESLPALSLNDSPPLKKPIYVELLVRDTPLPGVHLNSQPTPVHPDPPGRESKDTKRRGESPPPPQKTKAEPPPETASRTDPGRALPSPPVAGPPAAPDPEDEFSLGISFKGGKALPEEVQYQKYLLEIKQRVENNWKVSLDDEIHEGTTVVGAVASRDGTIWSIDILEPSGMILHDYEALEAVKRAFPILPPPPTLLNETGRLPIRFSFHYLLPPPPP